MNRDTKQYHTHFIVLSNVARISEEKEEQKITDMNNYEVLKKYVSIIILVYRLRKNNMYINQLELLVNKNSKQETYQVSYNMKTNAIERNEASE